LRGLLRGGRRGKGKGEKGRRQGGKEKAGKGLGQKGRKGREEIGDECYFQLF